MLQLTGTGLAPRDVIAVAREGALVELASEAAEAMERSAEVVSRLTAHAERPLVVLAHDLAWREDAGGLAGLWDAAAASEGRLCAILTAPGLPSNPWARAALLEASLVGVHRVDSPADAEYLRHGGILPLVLRRMIAAA